jgi:hypothetical protein
MKQIHCARGRARVREMSTPVLTVGLGAIVDTVADDLQLAAARSLGVRDTILS